MKIYTEINYKWLDGQLVEIDSKSFDYEGKLSLCVGAIGAAMGGGGGGGNPVTDIVDAVTTTASDVGTTVADTTSAAVDSTSAAITGAVSGASTSVADAGTVLSDAGAVVAEQVDQAIIDPVGSITTGLGKVSEPVLEAMTTGGEVIGASTNKGLEYLNEGLSTGVESIGMNEGVATTLGDIGGKIDEAVTSFGDKMVDDDLEDAFNTNIDYLHDYGKALNTIVSDELTRWSDFLMEKGKEASANFPGMGGGGDGDDVDDPDKLKAVKRGLKNKSRANLKVNKSKGRARSSLRVS